MSQTALEYENSMGDGIIDWSVDPVPDTTEPVPVEQEPLNNPQPTSQGETQLQTASIIPGLPDMVLGIALTIGLVAYLYGGEFA